MATGMFDSSEITYRFNVIVLSAILATAIICGGIFDFCRWMKHRMKQGTVTLKIVIHSFTIKIILTLRIGY